MQNVTEKYNELLETKMTRKQFIKNLGIGALSLIGLSALFGILSHGPTSSNKTAAGYGEGYYGGKPKSVNSTLDKYT